MPSEAELRKVITDRILESAVDPDGFLSDGFDSVYTENRDEIEFNGLIDVHHLVSEILLAIE